jgi:hypothetical protein
LVFQVLLICRGKKNFLRSLYWYTENGAWARSAKDFGLFYGHWAGDRKDEYKNISFVIAFYELDMS